MTLDRAFFKNHLVVPACPKCANGIVATGSSQRGCDHIHRVYCFICGHSTPEFNNKLDAWVCFAEGKVTQNDGGHKDIIKALYEAWQIT